MNMKKIKKFFTQARQHDGFTLVELIVVIAILAILGGVAVPAYGGYVKKANMTADQALVAEVADALTLYYYSHPGTQGGYVILSTDGIRFEDGVSVDESVGASAMAAVFGDAAVNLKYDGWNNNGLLNLVAGYSLEDAQKIMNSTFLAKSNAADMMDATNSLLKLAAGKISESENAQTYLNALGGTVGSTISGLGLEAGTEDYGTAVSNALVGHFAGAMSSGETGTDDTNSVTQLATYYASVYAYCQDIQDNTLIDALNAELENASYSDIIRKDNTDYFGSKMQNSVGIDKVVDFAVYMDGASGQSDEEALSMMMGAVNIIAGDYTDKDSLLNEDLFSSESAIMDQVNTYVNAVDAVANGNVVLSDLQPGEVAVILFADGSVSTTIGAAE